MSEAGYTLSEMLAALVMIGLATGGLVEGMQVIGQIQAQSGRAVGEGRAIRSAQAGLEGLLAGQGPFDATSGHALAGSGGAFTFDCGAMRSCGAALRPVGEGLRLDVTRASGTSQTLLPASATRAHFVYVAGGQSLETWPAPGTGRQPLKSIALWDDRGEALADVRLWAEQPRLCAFDVISQACRSAPP